MYAARDSMDTDPIFAKHHYELALQSNPLHAESALALGQLLHQTDPPRAKQLYETALSARPSFATAHVTRSTPWGR